MDYEPCANPRLSRNPASGKCLNRWQAAVTNYSRLHHVSGSEAAAALSETWNRTSKPPKPGAARRAKVNRQIRQIALAEGKVIPFRKHVPAPVAHDIARRYGL